MFIKKKYDGQASYDHEEGVCGDAYATPVKETEEEQDNDEPPVKKPKMDPSRDKTAKPAILVLGC